MKAEFRKHLPIFLGCLLSVLFLLSLGALRVNYPEFSSLEAHWVLLGVIPLILSLFFGGYISKLNAFGIEIDATLQTSILEKVLYLEKENLSERLIAEGSHLPKQSYAFLSNLSETQKTNAKILRFEMGTRYNIQVVERYLQELQNLEFVELVTRNSRFVAVIPVSLLFTFYPAREDYLPDDETPLSIFLDAVRSGGFRNMDWVFDANCAEKLKQDYSLRQVVDIFKLKKAKIAVVVDNNDRYLGAITRENIIEVLADLVRDTSEKVA